ncbi:hypothetical protein CERSUDRAFT_70389 [Gelatoporia subvermispora B]|uniref:Uncharacterized protein n=1 Tax=Ceriporiopsis subvermispora (strain B) TaxID=914234 RepID=M2QXV9_CERS8|nr:hypothetical protein CERSUDRAFT_70389 [Gelatoporia subvermispora B]
MSPPKRFVSSLRKQMQTFEFNNPNAYSAKPARATSIENSVREHVASSVDQNLKRACSIVCSTEHTSASVSGMNHVTAKFKDEAGVEVACEHYKYECTIDDAAVPQSSLVSSGSHGRCDARWLNFEEVVSDIALEMYQRRTCALQSNSSVEDRTLAVAILKEETPVQSAITYRPSSNGERYEALAPSKTSPIILLFAALLQMLASTTPFVKRYVQCRHFKSFAFDPQIPFVKKKDKAAFIEERVREHAARKGGANSKGAHSCLCSTEHRTTAIPENHVRAAFKTKKGKPLPDEHVVIPWKEHLEETRNTAKKK